MGNFALVKLRQSLKATFLTKRFIICGFVNADLISFAGVSLKENKLDNEQ